MNLKFDEWVVLFITIISIGMLFHLVLDAHGVFDERRKRREEEKKED